MRITHSWSVASKTNLDGWLLTRLSSERTGVFVDSRTRSFRICRTYIPHGFPAKCQVPVNLAKRGGSSLSRPTLCVSVFVHPFCRLCAPFRRTIVRISVAQLEHLSVVSGGSAGVAQDGVTGPLSLSLRLFLTPLPAVLAFLSIATREQPFRSLFNCCCAFMCYPTVYSRGCPFQLLGSNARENARSCLTVPRIELTTSPRHKVD